MANITDILNSLSEAQKKQVIALVDGGLSEKDALKEVGIDADFEANNNNTGDTVKKLAGVGVNLATGNIPGLAMDAAGFIIDAIGKNATDKKAKEQAEEKQRAASVDAESEQSESGKGLQTAGAILGAAQTIGGIVQGQKTEIPEFTESSNAKKAADMLTKAYEEGIDPNILAEGQKDIEMRRRSMIYQNEGSSAGAGERYNRDVVANLLANKAGKDLTIGASREKYNRLAPAANALTRLDEMEYRKDLSRREQGYMESEAAGGMIGAGIDNIIGSLMLGEQFKAENKRKKYDE